MAVASLVHPMPPRELAFISWAGLRGAVPIVLATIPLAEDVDGADQLFDIVFVIVVIYTLLTGPTLPLVAKVLKVPAAASRVTSRSRRRPRADRRRPAPGDHLAEVADARCRGRGAAAAARLLGGADRAGRKTMVPERRTVLRHGDNVLVVTPRKDREATEQRLRAVSVGGRLAQWLGKKAPSWTRPQSTSSRSRRGRGRRIRPGAFLSRPRTGRRP